MNTSLAYQGRGSRRAARVARSQLAYRLALAFYAALCILILLRCAVLVFGLSPGVWSVQSILTLSMPLVVPLGVASISGRQVIGAATLADLTTALVLLALLLPFLARERRG